MHTLCEASESAGETPRLSRLSGSHSTASPTSSSPPARSPGIHCRHRDRDTHAASVALCSRSPCIEPANWRPERVPVPARLRPVVHLHMRPVPLLNSTVVERLCPVL